MNCVQDFIFVYKCFTLFISFYSPLNNNLHGISSHPCDESAEYYIEPMTVHLIVPPLLINSEQIRVFFR